MRSLSDDRDGRARSNGLFTPRKPAWTVCGTPRKPAWTVCGATLHKTLLCEAQIVREALRFTAALLQR